MCLTGNRTHDLSSEVTGADVNFEHQSYHCATLTAEGSENVMVTVKGRKLRMGSPPVKDQLPILPEI
jgi:hypothetical protein